MRGGTPETSIVSFQLIPEMAASMKNWAHWVLRVLCKLTWRYSALTLPFQDIFHGDSNTDKALALNEGLHLVLSHLHGLVLVEGNSRNAIGWVNGQMKAPCI